MPNLMKCLLSLLVAICFGCAQAESIDGPATEEKLLATYRERAVEKWEDDIRKLEAKDRAETHPEESILFIGSSSIRRWNTIAEDVAPFHPIQRGYGGAKYSDLAVFANRLIRPHHYQAMVVFVANSIRGKDDDNTVDGVDPLVRHIVQVSRQHQQHAPVFIVEVTPSSSRFSVWPEIRQLNARLREIALTTPHTYFIPTASHYLLPSTKRPNDQLFVKDLLHLNRDGYRIWGRIIRQRLTQVLRLEKLHYLKNLEAGSSTAS